VEIRQCLRLQAIDLLLCLFDEGIQLPSDRPAPAVAPHNRLRSADACRSAIDRPVLFAATRRFDGMLPLLVDLALVGHLVVLPALPTSPLGHWSRPRRHTAGCHRTRAIPAGSTGYSAAGAAGYADGGRRRCRTSTLPGGPDDPCHYRRRSGMDASRPILSR